MKVLFAASEVSPFAKVGGLADVVGSLPGALRRERVETRVVMPKYRVIRPELMKDAVFWAAHISQWDGEGSMPDCFPL